ncbi:MAG: hypothetical protein HY537_03960 [Deltaproteobacteria bacterium]|nr:hypothetical protein [Deltaproteobacteria bacterium]
MPENVVVPHREIIKKISNKKDLTIEDLLEDQDVAAFFHYVYTNDLRLKAIELLEKRLAN